MDTMLTLIMEDSLPVWDSVSAKMQTAGRGSMGKHWISLEGNIFGAVRLPFEYPFTTSAASVAFGALCAESLRRMGYEIWLKWPNDLIIFKDQEYYKTGGILIEEHSKKLIAGIGINIIAAPAREWMDDPEALPGGYLEEVKPDLDASIIWEELVEEIYLLYHQSTAFSNRWKALAESVLLWRGENVSWKDGANMVRGIFCGLSDSGGALLDIGAAMEEKTSGNMRLLRPVN